MKSSQNQTDLWLKAIIWNRKLSKSTTFNLINKARYYASVLTCILNLYSRYQCLWTFRSLGMNSCKWLSDSCWHSRLRNLLAVLFLARLAFSLLSHAHVIPSGWRKRRMKELKFPSFFQTRVPQPQKKSLKLISA